VLDAIAGDRVKLLDDDGVELSCAVLQVLNLKQYVVDWEVFSIEQLKTVYFTDGCLMLVIRTEA